MTLKEDWPLALGLVAAFWLGSAVVAYDMRNLAREEPAKRQSGVTVFHDKERRVTCWISPGIGMQAHGAGISCLPDASFTREAP
jgi:hypothetical protein